MPEHHPAFHKTPSEVTIRHGYHPALPDILHDMRQVITNIYRLLAAHGPACLCDTCRPHRGAVYTLELYLYEMETSAPPDAAEAADAWTEYRDMTRFERIEAELKKLRRQAKREPGRRPAQPPQPAQQPPAPTPQPTPTPEPPAPSGGA
jgi:hypothetical protein